MPSGFQFTRWWKNALSSRKPMAGLVYDRQMDSFPEPRNIANGPIKLIERERPKYELGTNRNNELHCKSN